MSFSKAVPKFWGQGCLVVTFCAFVQQCPWPDSWGGTGPNTASDSRGPVPRRWGPHPGEESKMPRGILQVTVADEMDTDR